MISRTDSEERHNVADTPEYSHIQAQLATQLDQWFAAHETAINRAFDRDVRGRGQIHPPSTGYGDSRLYVLEEECLDGDDSLRK